MFSKVLRSFIIVLSLSLFLPGVIQAKGPPSKVTITGPGLVEEVEITDPDQLMAFSFFQFENIGRKIEPPATTGEGYVVTRHVQDGTKLTPWDRVIYYPGSNGELGIVFLEGLIGESSSEFDGYWYWASRDGDMAMQKILTEYVAVTPEERPLDTPSPITPMVITLSLLAVLAIVGIVVTARRATRQAG